MNTVTITITVSHHDMKVAAREADTIRNEATCAIADYMDDRRVLSQVTVGPSVEHCHDCVDCGKPVADDEGYHNDANDTRLCDQCAKAPCGESIKA